MSASSRPDESGAATRRIVDAHVHVASVRYIPQAFLRGVARNMVAASPARVVLPEETLVRFLTAQHQDHHADLLVQQMNDAGIERAVLLAPDFSHALPGEMPAEELAECHHAIRLRHPGRFFVFQGIDPRGGPRALEILENAVVRYGFEGLKLYPPCGYSPSDRSLWPFYDLCRQYRLPVLIHTGPTSPVLSFGFSHPREVDGAALAFPDVNFIIAHGGVNHCEDATLMCAYRPNVFLDIAGFPSTLHPQGWAANLAALFRLKINHKVIFGTDWPLVGMTDSIRNYVEKLLAADGPLAAIAADEIDSIIYGNITRLVNPRVPAGQHLAETAAAARFAQQPAHN